MRKSFRNLLAVLLAGIMILQPFSVLAEENTRDVRVRRQGTLELIQRGSQVYTETDSGTGQRLSGISENETERVKELLYSGLDSLQPEIDVSEYELTPDEFQQILQAVLNTSPELFYVGKGYSYTIFYADTDLSEEKQRVFSYYPEYEKSGDSLSEDEIENMRAELNRAATKVLSKVNPEWSDREKALFIHDHLAAQCEYDTRDPQSDTDPCQYDMYSLLVEGRAVCEGYSLTFLYFMKQLGIPCAVMPSNPMRHMWNQVQLDGEWYHVDVTWDDPLNVLEQDMPGKVNHSHFLLSDAAMAALDYTWDLAKGNVCADTTYDSYFWNDLDSSIVSDGTKWFFVKKSGDVSGIYRWDPVDDPAALAADKIVDLSSYNWKASNGGIYVDKFTKLAVHGGKVYFNTPSDILCFDTNAEGVISGETAPEMTGTFSGTLFGIRLRDEKLEYITAVTTVVEIDGTEEAVIVPSEPKTAFTFEVPDPTYPPVSTPEPSQEPSVSENPDSSFVTESPLPEIVTENTKTEGCSQAGTPALNLAADSGMKNSGAAENSSGVNPGQTVSSGLKEDGTEIRSQIKITARRGKKTITVRVPKKARAVITINKKIIQNGKKRCKKFVLSAAKNKSGKIVLKVSSKLKKGMRIGVTVYVTGKKTRKVVKV